MDVVAKTFMPSFQAGIETDQVTSPVSANLSTHDCEVLVMVGLPGEQWLQPCACFVLHALAVCVTSDTKYCL